MFNPLCPTELVAELSLLDDASHIVARLKPGVQYGLDVEGGEGVCCVTRDGEVSHRDVVVYPMMGRIWFQVAMSSCLSVKKRVCGTTGALVRVVRV